MRHTAGVSETTNDPEIAEGPEDDNGAAAAVVVVVLFLLVFLWIPEPSRPAAPASAEPPEVPKVEALPPSTASALRGQAPGASPPSPRTPTPSPEDEDLAPALAVAPPPPPPEPETPTPAPMAAGPPEDRGLLRLEAEVVDAGSALVVHLSPAGHSGAAPWLAVFPEGAPRGSEEAVELHGHQWTAGPSAEAGAVTLVAPDEPGAYEVRLFFLEREISRVGFRVEIEGEGAR